MCLQYNFVKVPTMRTQTVVIGPILLVLLEVCSIIKENCILYDRLLFIEFIRLDFCKGVVFFCFGFMVVFVLINKLMVNEILVDKLITWPDFNF